MRTPASALSLSMFARLAIVIVAALSLVGCDRGPSGTYEAKAPAGEEGAMTLEFLKDNKVKVSIGGGGMSMTTECEYTVDGDTVNIKPPAGAGAGMGDNLVLTRKGSTYETNLDGEKLVFTKK